MSDRVYTTQADTGVTQDFDAAWHTFGVEIRLSAPGVLVGGRARYPSTDPANFIWALYRLSDQAIMASVDLAAHFGAGATNNAWNPFTSNNFGIPGEVALLAYPAESYIVVQATNGDFLFKNTGVSYPVSSGGIVSGVQARLFNGGSGLTFPTGTNSTDYFFADVEVDTAATPAGRLVYLPRELLLRVVAANLAQWQNPPPAGVEHVETFTDDAGLTDARVLDLGMARTDDVGLTDTWALTVAGIYTDSAGLTDTAALTVAGTATDLVGLTDSATVQAAKLVTADDSAGLTDTAAFAAAVERTDSAGLTDSAALAIASSRTDSAGLTDTAAVIAVRFMTVDDSAGLTDATMVEVAKLVVATDSAGLTDTHALTRAATHTDSAGLTDTAAITRSAVHTDSAGLTDTAAMVQAATVTDSAGLTDTSIVLPIKLVAATDSAGLTDGVITQTGAGTIFLPPGLVPVRALSPAEILTGNRSTRFRYDLYSKTEAALGILDGVTKGKVDFTASASVHSGGAIEVTDNGQTVDWLNNRVRPVAIIEGLPEIPLGMFLIAEAPEEWDDTGRSWSVKLMDKTSILDQDKVDGTYSLDAGTVITTAAAALIASTGETNIAVTPSAATLSAPLAWETGTTKLRIVNDLLAVAGYFSLWCDGNGQFRGEPYVRPANRPIRYEFLDGEQSIYSPEFVRDVDLFSIPNKFVAVGQGSGGTEALTSVATNTDPGSPYSFAARGRWIVGTATGVEAASQAVLDAYARRRLIELTSPTSSIEVAHALVPDLTFNAAVRLRRVPAGVDARHVVTKMVVELSPAALVKSTLQEVIDL